MPTTAPNTDDNEMQIDTTVRAPVQPIRELNAEDEDLLDTHQILADFDDVHFAPFANKNASRKGKKAKKDNALVTPKIPYTENQLLYDPSRKYTT
jgi:hypothetical protein